MLVNPSYAHARVSQRSESTGMFSQPTFGEREHAFLVNPAIAPGKLYTVSPEIAEPPSLRNTYDLVGNQARAHQAPFCSTWYGPIGNEARASQVPSYSTRYGLVGNEARTAQAPSYSTQYDLVDNETRDSQASSYSPRYGLVSKEARTSQPHPSVQYSSPGSGAQYTAPPFGLHYETSDGQSGYSFGFSVERHGETLANDFWNPTESINPQPDAASRYL